MAYHRSRTAPVLFSISVAFAAVCLPAAPALAQAGGCPDGSYSISLSPDGGTLAILFDDFVVEAGAGIDAAAATKSCQLHIPLQLPAGTSVGVYRVDYRGFTFLAQRQQFELVVDYGFGSKDHSYRRQLREQQAGEFTFTETIGAGLIRRVGCGESAALDLTATIRLDGGGVQDYALGTLDSADGAPKGGLIYYLDYVECRGPANR